MIDSTRPTGATIQATPRNGMIDSTEPHSATTNPAVARPFDRCGGLGGGWNGW
jgi:hypothetical protein